MTYQSGGVLPEELAHGRTSSQERGPRDSDRAVLQRFAAGFAHVGGHPALAIRIHDDALLRRSAAAMARAFRLPLVTEYAGVAR